MGSLSSQGMTLCSPAKVNLFFKVLGRREDGYHEILSLMQAISLCDEIFLERSEKDVFTCSCSSIPLDGSNLVLKALSLFREKTGLSFPVKIHLSKHIPIEAGLGGGSSNAATTLFGLNSLSGNPLCLRELQQLGASLGADVPFFFSQGTAYCTGRGDLVENREPLQEEELWIAKPKEGLSTAKVYAHFKKDNSRLGEESIPFNDLESAALILCPQLETYKEDLLSLGFSKVVMTGSGTALMCFGTPHTQECSLPLYKVHYLRRQENGWYEQI